MPPSEQNPPATPSVRRALSGSAASAFATGISLAQGVLFPLVALRFWTAEQFGAWATVIAYLSFFSVVDYSHQTYVGNRFTILLNRRQRDQADRAMAAGARCALHLSLAKAGLLAVLFFWAEPGSILRLAFPLLAAHTLSSGLLGMVVQVYRPLGQYARTVYLQTAATLLSILAALVAIVAAEAGPSGAIATLALSRVVLEAGLIAYTFRRFRLSLRLPDPDGEGLRNLRLSFGHLATAALDYGVLHGSIIALERLAGAAQAGMFTTVRTLSNMVVQNLALMLWPVAHDFVRMRERSDGIGLQAMFGFAWMVTLLFTGAAALAIILVGDPVFQWWTKDRFGSGVPLLGLLTGAAFCRALSLPAFAYFQQFNRTGVLMALSGCRLAVFVCTVAALGPTPLGFALAALSAEAIASAAGAWKLTADPALRGLGLTPSFSLPWHLATFALALGMALSAASPGGAALGVAATTAGAGLWGWHRLGPAVRLRLAANLRQLRRKPG